MGKDKIKSKNLAKKAENEEISSLEILEDKKNFNLNDVILATPSSLEADLKDTSLKVIQKVYEDADIKQEGVELFASVLKSESISSQDSMQIAQKISNTIETLDANYKDLVQAKKQGVSSSAWLVRKLDEFKEHNGINETNTLVENINDNLKQATKKNNPRRDKPRLK